MDSTSSIAALTHLFPQRCSPGSELTPLFFSSVRHITIAKQDALLIHALNLTTKESFYLRIVNLNFFIVAPRSALTIGSFNNLVESVAPRFFHDYVVYNGDLKCDMEARLYVVDSIATYKRLVSEGTAILKRCGENMYTYGDYVTTYDGNTIALYNNLLCSHVYYASLKDSAYSPWDFTYDEARDSEYVMKLNTIIPFCKREAAFDIETIVQESAMDPDLCCLAFEKHEFSGMADAVEMVTALKDMGMTGIPTSPFNGITQKLHEITSISLVVCNYHLPKKDRKELIVYYNAKLIKSPLQEISTDYLGLDYSRIKFQECKNEFYMLLKFINKLKKSVDVLYVYNAQFDIKVILQRLAYYAFSRRTATCCKTHSEIPHEWGLALQEKWENFLSAKPNLFKGQIFMGCDILQDQYLRTLKSALNVLKMPGDISGKIGLAKKKFSDYLRSKDTVQNFRTYGFTCDIIDMMYVCKRKEFEAKDGSLNTIAHLIITKYNPKKMEVKSRKLKDVTYDKLDEYYRAGGTKLAECLIYNLIDSQLVVRLAKVLKPMEEYIFRQLACYNIDIAAHTRGVMNFNGFIQSTKVVEVSRNKARLDAGIVLAVGNLHNSLFKPETVPRRGGYVMNPLTGLFFAQPSQCFELCLDFTSLYPSIMCDLNISPETIVNKENIAHVPDFMGYDWSKIPQGFDKYTLVLKLDRSDPKMPVLKRHFSDTSVSLKRYLKLRNYHKKQLKSASDPFEREYHNRLQGEMKVCANTHYGVSEHTCSLMITTQGQHKIKHVNAFIKTLNHNEKNLFPNYGDTDSTMFFHPPDNTEQQLDDTIKTDFQNDLRQYMLKKMSTEMCNYIKTKVQNTDVFVNSFLQDIEQVLLEDMLSKLELFTTKGSAFPSKCSDGIWRVCDPVTGVLIDCTTPFLDEMICKLEYENASSIGCHVAKKMVSWLFLTSHV